MVFEFSGANPWDPVVARQSHKEAGQAAPHPAAYDRHMDGINPSVRPSGSGCVECLANDAWWFHLRRCAQCGHIGCCDQSLGKHATAHFNATGHPVIASFEPGETWFYNYETGDFIDGPHIAPPRWHPEDQPVPGPRGKVPTGWQALL